MEELEINLKITKLSNDVTNRMKNRQAFNPYLPGNEYIPDGDSFPFDPGVLTDDDGRVYLYSGFYTSVPSIVTGGKKLRFDGGYVLELEQDMITMKGPEKLLFPKEGEGSFKNHEFFEASSIRKYDGSFAQSEMTSCGLNGGPLVGKGTYEARIACNLWSKKGTGRYDGKNPKKQFADHPCFTQNGSDKKKNTYQYIANLRDGSVSAFKYFECEEIKKICMKVRGNAMGRMKIAADREMNHMVSEIEVNMKTQDWISIEGRAEIQKGVHAFYFQYQGTGFVDFLEFTLE